MTTTKKKTHTLIVRGVEKSKKNALKKLAKDSRNSVNSIMLHAIDLYISGPYMKVSFGKELNAPPQTAEVKHIS